MSHSGPQVTDVRDGELGVQPPLSIAHPKATANHAVRHTDNSETVKAGEKYIMQHL